MKQSWKNSICISLTTAFSIGWSLSGCNADKIGEKYKITDSGDSNPATEDATVEGQNSGTIKAHVSGRAGGHVIIGVGSTGGDEGAELAVAISTENSNLVEGKTALITITSAVSQSENRHFIWNLVGIEESNRSQTTKEFLAVTGDVVINSGSLSGHFDITPVDDFIREGIESFSLQVTEPGSQVVSEITVDVHDGRDYVKGLIAAGASHGCSIKSGALFCWGLNRDGEAGIADGMLKTTASTVVTMGDSIEFISSQVSHSCAIKKSQLFCWGRNDTGQLGDGSQDRRLTPTPVHGLTSDIEAVAVGSGHSCAIQKAAMFCWGENDSGELGTDSNTGQVIPTAVLLMDTGVTDITAGNGHTCAIKGGALYCWGRNNLGQLGLGNNDDIKLPTQVSNFDKEVAQVVANEYQTCAIKKSQLFCWGNNESGQLGLGTDRNFYMLPQLVGAVTDVVSGVTMGLEHTCAVINAIPYCWGRGAEGQLGNSLTADTKVPGKIDSFGEDVISMAAGSHHTCMVGLTKRRCWGQGTDGQIGDGLRVTAITPKDIVFP